VRAEFLHAVKGPRCALVNCAFALVHLGLRIVRLRVSQNAICASASTSCASACFTRALVIPRIELKEHVPPLWTLAFSSTSTSVTVPLMWVFTRCT